MKCAKLLIEAMAKHGGEAPRIDPVVDCVMSGRIVELPGLVDVHVHVREPGMTHKVAFVTYYFLKFNITVFKIAI